MDEANAQVAVEARQEATDSSTVCDPLLDCLVMLTRHYHRPMTADALRAGLPLVDDRLTPRLFVRAAHRAGLAARVAKRDLRDINPLVLPAVLLLQDNQACVLLELDSKQGRARIGQPDAGQAEDTVDLVELQARYAGYALFVKPELRFDSRTREVQKHRHGHWFWGTLWRSRKIYRDVLLASFLINLFAVASPLFIMNVYDRVVPNHALETLWVLAIGISVVVVFDLIMRVLRGYFVDVAGKKSDIALSALIYERVTGMRMESRPESVGAFANNLREFESVRDFITSASLSTLIDLPFVVLFLAVIAFVAGPVVFIPLAVIPLVILYALSIQGRLRREIEASFEATAQKNAALIENLTGAETIKSLNAEGIVQSRWESLVGFIAKHGVRARLLSMSAVSVTNFLQQLSLVAMVIYGVYLISEGELSMGGLIAAVILSGRALTPLSQVANLATQYHQAKTAYGTLQNLMALPQERPEEKNFVRRPRLEGGIEFRQVTFKYPGQVSPALHNLSFRINPGEKVAFIGRIGSGKSTLEKLLLGLYEPQEGAVLVDGIDLRQIDPVDVRRNIGYVPQDNFLFYGSVRDNITFGTPYADDTAILRAAQFAGVNEFTDRHPLGLDLPVGERGQGLSGGQRQSVVIARAIVTDPPILVMDEPSNAMDNATEERLKRHLASLLQNKTMVLVTHRASLLDLVDRIIVLEAGSVVADGPKDQVLAALRQGKVRGMQR